MKNRKWIKAITILICGLLVVGFLIGMVVLPILQNLFG